MHGRTVVGNDGADFVASQDVVENLVLFEAIEKPRQKLCAKGGSRLRPKTRIKEPASVFRLVEILAEPGLAILVKEIELLAGFLDLRPNFFEL